MWNFGRGIFFIGGWERDKEWLRSFKTFLMLNTTFCKYWTSIKIKISIGICRAWSHKKRYSANDYLYKWSLHRVITWKFLCGGGMSLPVGLHPFSSFQQGNSWRWYFEEWSYEKRLLKQMPFFRIYLAFRRFVFNFVYISYFY